MRDNLFKIVANLLILPIYSKYCPKNFRKILKNSDLDDFRLEVSNYLTTFDDQYAILQNNYQNWYWYGNTDVTEENQMKMEQANAEVKAFRREQYPIAKCYLDLATFGVDPNFTDFDTDDHDILTNDQMRQLSKMVEIDTAALNDQDLENFLSIGTEMSSIYSEATVTIEGIGENLPLTPDLNDILQTSQDFDLLTAVWEGWREETGMKIKDLYRNNVKYMNKAAEINGYPDEGAVWRSWYEEPYFEEAVEILWQDQIFLDL